MVVAVIYSTMMSMGSVRGPGEEMSSGVMVAS